MNVRKFDKTMSLRDFQGLIKETMSKDGIKAPIDEALARAAWNHMMNVGKWEHGLPKRVFFDDHQPSIEYDDGLWWHYKLSSGTWY